MDSNNLNMQKLIMLGDISFGHKSWSHGIKSQMIDFTDNIQNYYVVGCTTSVRVFLTDGRIHEAMAFKESWSSTFGEAYDQSRNESFTRALHETLLFFKEFRDSLLSEEQQKVRRLEKQAQLKEQWQKKYGSG